MVDSEEDSFEGCGWVNSHDESALDLLLSLEAEAEAAWLLLVCLVVKKEELEKRKKHRSIRSKSKKQ